VLLVLLLLLVLLVLLVLTCKQPGRSLRGLHRRAA